MIQIPLVINFSAEEPLFESLFNIEKLNNETCLNNETTSISNLLRDRDNII